MLQILFRLCAGFSQTCSPGPHSRAGGEARRNARAHRQLFAEFHLHEGTQQAHRSDAFGLILYQYNPAHAVWRCLNFPQAVRASLPREDSSSSSQVPPRTQLHQLCRRSWWRARQLDPAVFVVLLLLWGGCGLSSRPCWSQDSLLARHVTRDIMNCLRNVCGHPTCEVLHVQVWKEGCWTGNEASHRTVWELKSFYTQKGLHQEKFGFFSFCQQNWHWLGVLLTGARHTGCANQRKYIAKTRSAGQASQRACTAVPGLVLPTGLSHQTNPRAQHITWTYD